MRPRRSLALAVALVLMSACADKLVITSPAGRQAYTANQIAQRVGELQNTVIQAELTGAIPESAALIIVRFTVSAEKTLQTVPAGWQATVMAGWAETKKLVPPEVQASPILAAVWGAVDVILAGGVQ